MGKKDNKAIFFTDDEQMGRLSEALVSLDVNLSELIRTCIDICVLLLLKLSQPFPKNGRVTISEVDLMPLQPVSEVAIVAAKLRATANDLIRQAEALEAAMPKPVPKNKKRISYKEILSRSIAGRACGPAAQPALTAVPSNLLCPVPEISETSRVVSGSRPKR